MEILRDFKQISSRVQNIFGIDVSNIQILDPIAINDLKVLLQNVQKPNKVSKEVIALAELIFQLNNYLPALCNFVKMFILTKDYESIVMFMEKTFVAHVGNSNYVSKNKDYSHKERFFDRFIEVVKSTDMSLCDILPFLFNIVEDNEKTCLSLWLSPTFEYLQNIFRENMQEVKDFVAINPQHKLTYLSLALEFNTQLAIAEIFKQEISEQNEQLFGKMLKHYYTDIMTFFDKNLEQAGDAKFHFVKILSKIENPEVTARLENLYEEESDPQIKQFIKNKLGINEQKSLGISPKHFQTMALKKVEYVQERTLGTAFENLQLTFTNGESATNTDKTHLINIFKEQKNVENLKDLKDIKNIFEANSLQQFTEGVFKALCKLQDIKEAKWAIRLVSYLSDGKLEQDIYDFNHVLFKTNRIKEAKYLLLCLIYSQKTNVINLISKLIEENNNAFIEIKDTYVELYAKNVAKNVDDVHEILSSETEISDQALKIQKDRLYQSFISNKSYTKDQFEEIFINKKVFNILAKDIVFGEYKQNRLLCVFVLEDNQKKYICGSEPNAECEVIKIVHSLDLDDRFEEVKQIYSNNQFNQFDNQVYNFKESEKTQTKVSNMQGVLISSLKFVTKMQNLGFVKNVSSESDTTCEMVHTNSILGLLAEVSFETPVTNYSSTSSLGEIRFYKLNQCLKNGSVYIINKANSISLSGVEPRYYNYVVSSVAKSLKNG